MAPPSLTQTVTEEEVRPVKNLPTLEEIKKAIPEQRWEKNAFKSIYFLIQDFVILAALYYILPTVEHYAGWPGLFIWYSIFCPFLLSIF